MKAPVQAPVCAPLRAPDRGRRRLLRAAAAGVVVPFAAGCALPVFPKRPAPAAEDAAGWVEQAGGVIPLRFESWISLLRPTTGSCSVFASYFEENMDFPTIPKCPSTFRAYIRSNRRCSPKRMERSAPRAGMRPNSG